MRGRADPARSGPASGRPADLPPYADWWARADFGPARSLDAASHETRLSDGASLHHDCPLGEILLRCGSARVVIETFGFRGSFLGLAVAPAAGAQGLKRRHVLRLDATILGADGPVYARLNLRSGDAVETQLRAMADVGDGPRRAEFDIAAMPADTSRLDHLWIDILFEAPAGTRITVADVLLVRRPRADL